jgi:hypothetical protein
MWPLHESLPSEHADTDTPWVLPHPTCTSHCCEAAHAACAHLPVLPTMQPVHSPMPACPATKPQLPTAQYTVLTNSLPTSTLSTHVHYASPYPPMPHPCPLVQPSWLCLWARVCGAAWTSPSPGTRLGRSGWPRSGPRGCWGARRRCGRVRGAGGSGGLGSAGGKGSAWGRLGGGGRLLACEQILEDDCWGGGRCVKWGPAAAGGKECWGRREECMARGGGGG